VEEVINFQNSKNVAYQAGDSGLTLVGNSPFGDLVEGINDDEQGKSFSRNILASNRTGDVVYQIFQGTKNPDNSTTVETTAYVNYFDIGTALTLTMENGSPFDPGILQAQMSQSGKVAVTTRDVKNPAMATIGKWTGGESITEVVRSEDELLITGSNTPVKIITPSLLGIDDLGRVLFSGTIEDSEQNRAIAFLREPEFGLTFENILDANTEFDGVKPKFLGNPNAPALVPSQSKDGRLVRNIAFPHPTDNSPTAFKGAIVRERESGAMEIVVDSRFDPPSIPTEDLPPSYSTVGWSLGQHYVDLDGHLAFFGTVGNPNSDGFKGLWAESSTGHISLVVKTGENTFTPNVVDIVFFDSDNKNTNNQVLLTLRTGGFNTAYLATIPTGPPKDYGDAPVEPSEAFPGDPFGYPTQGEMAAYHGIAPYRLGPSITAEADGIPHELSLGDEGDDGVTFPTPGPLLEVPELVDFMNSVFEGIPVLFSDSTGVVAVEVHKPEGSPPLYLNGWIDFNRDHTWDAGEQIIKNHLALGGTENHEFPIPVITETNNTFARFRLSDQADNEPAGFGGNGEVEDYIYCRA
jgi:hypothetical protein